MSCDTCKWLGKWHLLDENGKTNKVVFAWCTSGDLSEEYRYRMAKENRGKGCIGWEGTHNDIHKKHDTGI